MMRRFAFLIAPLSFTAAAAQGVAAPTDADLAAQLDPGMTLETRLDADFNGDGLTDTAFMQRGEDARSLKVLIAYRSETDMGHDGAGVLTLDPYALGAASLSARKGVLLVEDLTGGTTAVASRRRFRYDPAARRMRMIGLDATLYSRTNAHDRVDMSWNLLTGDLITSRSKLHEGPSPDDTAYDAPLERKAKRAIAARYMEDAPDPEGLVMGDDALTFP